EYWSHRFRHDDALEIFERKILGHHRGMVHFAAPARRYILVLREVARTCAGERHPSHCSASHRKKRYRPIMDGRAVSQIRHLRGCASAHVYGEQPDRPGKRGRIEVSAAAFCPAASRVSPTR